MNFMRPAAGQPRGHPAVAIVSRRRTDGAVRQSLTQYATEGEKARFACRDLSHNRTRRPAQLAGAGPSGF